MKAPLEDPAYEPLHPPVDGLVPDVVERWGPRSQLRWFERYHSALKPQPTSVWERFYVSSVSHRGDCCISCIEDGEYFENYCCCKAIP